MHWANGCRTYFLVSYKIINERVNKNKNPQKRFSQWSESVEHLCSRVRYFDIGWLSVAKVLKIKYLTLRICSRKLLVKKYIFLVFICLALFNHHAVIGRVWAFWKNSYIFKYSDHSKPGHGRDYKSLQQLTPCPGFAWYCILKLSTWLTTPPSD